MQNTENDRPETLAATLFKRCEWTDVGLIEREGRREMWHGHPGESWSAWEVSPDEPAPDPIVPYQRLLGDDGAISPSFLLRRTVKLMEVAGIGPNDLGRMDLQAAAAFTEADRRMRRNWRRYVRAIPAEHRALVGPLDSGQWRFLMALAADPGLAGDLRAEFAAAGTGHVFACIALAGISFPSGPADARLLRDALRAPRAEFLSQLAGRKIDKPTARILGKAASITNRHSLLKIVSLARDPAFRQVLSHMPRLEYAVFHGAATLPRAAITPGVLQLLARVETEYRTRDKLGDLAREIIRRRRQDTGAFASSIASATSPADLSHRMGEWSVRLLPPPKPARPPFPGDDRLVPLTSIEALTRAGQRYQNCLAHGFMVRNYVNRDSIVYEWRGRRPALVHLSRENGAWLIAEIRDAMRKAPPPSVCNRIARDVYRRLLRVPPCTVAARGMTPDPEFSSG